MKFDGTSVVRAKAYYKDHSLRVDGVLVPHRVFVAWGEFYVDGEAYVGYGSPYQIAPSEDATGLKTDIPVYIVWERVDTSFPTEGQPSVTLPANQYGIHWKPGINI